MRIIAGQWRGQRIAAPVGQDTRPTADRVREAIFSAIFSLLGDLDGLEVLDIYAGSGALGLEALSRGADHCTFVDSGRRAVDVIAENIASLRVAPGKTAVLHTRVERLRPEALCDRAVSLLLADPPYRIDAVEFSQVLEALAAAGVIQAQALVMYEHSASVEAVWPSGFTPGSVRRYGDTGVSFATYEG